ncbi:MAG: hypothetical protein AMXMBFR48_30070 [Ignavibacteriales bacterium]
MKWSKLKHTIEGCFADEVRGKVHIYTTKYTAGSNFMVRGWITIDKKEIANFSTPDNHARFGHSSPDHNERISAEERTEGDATEKGEFAQWELPDACLQYINQSIEQSLSSPNPIIRCFAMLDRRTGKRRLLSLETTDMHPLVKRMYELRMEATGMNERKGAIENKS